MINDDLLIISWMIFYNNKVLSSTRGIFLRIYEDYDNILDLAPLVINLMYKSFNLSRVFEVS